MYVYMQQKHCYFTNITQYTSTMCFHNCGYKFVKFTFRRTALSISISIYLYIYISISIYLYLFLSI